MQTGDAQALGMSCFGRTTQLQLHAAASAPQRVGGGALPSCHVRAQQHCDIHS